MMPKDGTILVAAPRKNRFDALDPGSLIVLSEYDRRHPANEAYSQPPAEICICEGDGVKGDPARAKSPKGNPPWRVWPTNAVSGKIAAGQLVRVEEGEDTSDLQLSANDLASLTSLTPRQVQGLVKRGFETVDDLAEKIGRSDDAVTMLQGQKGKSGSMSEGKAKELLNELISLGVIEGTGF
jgi:hypothetical protein